MNILIVHNYYKLPGGEDVVMENEKNMLEKHGNKVVLYTRTNKELDEASKLQKLMLPINTIFNMKTYKDIRKIIVKEKIEIVHVHNTLNLISPSVYYAAWALKVPVVQTVHNFRFMCPAATFYRKDHICEECMNKGLQCSVKHKCYRGSLVNTLASAATLKIHRIIGTYKKLYYINLTKFNESKMLEYNKKKGDKLFNPDRMYVKPNFIADNRSKELIFNGEEPISNNNELITNGTSKKDFYIFVGRLEKIKGIHIILKAWKILGEKAPKLIICGTGELDEKCANYAKANGLHNVEFKGYVPNDEVKELINDSRALLFPVQWYEGFGLVMVEAMQQGTISITSDMGNANDIGVGIKYKYDSSDALAEAIMKCENMSEEQLNQMVQMARDEYHAKYTEDVNYGMLKNIYRDVIRRKSE